jgi:YfiH family protein
MIEVNTDEISYLQYAHLIEHPQVVHFVSTRKGGISPAPGKGLNVGFHVHDAPENVIKNREALAKVVGISLQSFCLLNQVHGCRVAVVGKQERGKGIQNYEDSIANTDALVTNEAGVCLNVLSADCVCILFYDPVKQAIGAAHSGWKGTVKKIAAEVVLTMQNEFGSKPQDILVGVGPGISPKIYEVGTEVEQAVVEAFGTIDGMISYHPDTGNPHFDLWAAIDRTLIEIGVPTENIEHSSLCTYQNEEMFFSYRRDKGKTGRFTSGIMLK